MVRVNFFIYTSLDIISSNKISDIQILTAKMVFAFFAVKIGATEIFAACIIMCYVLSLSVLHTM